jgi:1,4-alpha-glucan branching enzyme
VVVIANMTPVPRDGYRIPMPLAGNWVERLNTDAGWYGGTNKGNQGRVVATPSEVEGLGPYADLYLPPMSTLYLKYDPT